MNNFIFKSMLIGWLMVFGFNEVRADGRTEVLGAFEKMIPKLCSLRLLLDCARTTEQQCLVDVPQFSGVCIDNSQNPLPDTIFNEDGLNFMSSFSDCIYIEYIDYLKAETGDPTLCEDI